MELLVKIVADINIPYVSECFSSIDTVQLFNGREITADIIKDADILLVRSVTNVNQQLLDNSSVKFVATATIGVDHIDRDYLAAKRIGFASAPGSNANSVAEYVAAAMLQIGAKKSIALAGASIGIIGAGNVGSMVAKKAAALGMKVLLNDPPLQRQNGDKKYRSLDEIYSCDFITLHTPLTYDGIDRTNHLADAKFFSQLKNGCVFINSSRGGVVDSIAIKAAIKSGRLSGCVLDVWENEPQIDTELLAMTDIATPHIAGYSFDGKVSGMIMIYNAACEYFGIAKKYNAASFLPQAAISKLNLNAAGKSDQQVITEAVSAVYDICADDAGLRAILAADSKERGKIFDSLRKNYPIRREFTSTTIALTAGSDILKTKLAGIGFKIES